jgi:hypothetical protein
MTTFPGSPRLLKGGIVLIDPDSSAMRRIIALQYNPDTLSLAALCRCRARAGKAATDSKRCA